MKFELDYEKLILLDAEALAEGGIGEAYTSILPSLKLYVAEPAEVHEFADPAGLRYAVSCRGMDYTIYSPGLPNDGGQSWGRAAYALFKVINDQLSRSEHRLFAINAGNDLGGMFLTQSDCEKAKASLPRPEDWPYLPTLEHPWYGQLHP